LVFFGNANPVAAQADGHFILPYVCTTHASAVRWSVFDVNNPEWQKNEKENCFKAPEGIFFRVLQRSGEHAEIELLGSDGTGKIAARGRVWAHQNLIERFFHRR
jgi:hypothetical protein